MSNRDLVAIGTSAGGVAALLYLAERFPPDFPASILVTIHLSNQFRSSLDEILTRAGPLPASFARDGDTLEKARIYLAPPDRHLLVEGEKLSLGGGPRENNVRPAIDPMLRSAAICCGGRATGVVLTGTMSDGASGLWAIDQCGGMSVIQDPRDAAFPEMPQNAMNRTRADHIVSLRDMPALLDSLAHQSAGPIPEGIRYEDQVAKTGHTSMTEMDRIGRRSVLACPDCHGVTWEIDEDDLTRFRCQVGHTYTADLMCFALDENRRRALGVAQRALKERLALALKLQKRAADNGQPYLAASWAGKAHEYEQEMAIIRDSIQRIESIAAAEELKRMVG